MSWCVYRKVADLTYSAEDDRNMGRACFFPRNLSFLQNSCFLSHVQYRSWLISCIVSQRRKFCFSIEDRCPWRSFQCSDWEGSSGSCRIGETSSHQRGIAVLSYLYQEHLNKSSTNNALYTELQKCEGAVMYNIQIQKLSKMFQLLPKSVGALFGITNHEPPRKPVVERFGQEWVLESTCYPGMPGSLLIKNDAVSAESLLQFCDSRCINVTVSRTRGSISETTQWPSKRQRLLMSSSWFPLLIGTEKPKSLF